MTSPQPELIVDRRCHNAEGPLWHPIEQRLYWTDIPQGQVFRYDPASGSHEQVYEGDPVGGMTMQPDGSMLLFQARGAIAHWHKGKMTPIVPEIPGEQDGRFNDLIADPKGRVFCGTMPTSLHLGRLYRLNLDGTIEKVLDEIQVANGMGFSPDRQWCYFTETEARHIYRFDYDAESGQLTDQQVLIETPANEGMPDGLTVDAEGYLWSGRWNGGHLFRYAPDGTEVLRIPFPARKVTSLIFGGPDYTDIFVTTAGGYDRDTEGDGAGGIFHLNLGIQGKPEFCSRIQV